DGPGLDLARDLRPSRLVGQPIHACVGYFSQAICRFRRGHRRCSGCARRRHLCQGRGPYTSISARLCAAFHHRRNSPPARPGRYSLIDPAHRAFGIVAARTFLGRGPLEYTFWATESFLRPVLIEGKMLAPRANFPDGVWARLASAVSCVAKKE